MITSLYIRYIYSEILIHVSNEQFVYKRVGSISHVTTLFYKLASLQLAHVTLPLHA